MQVIANRKIPQIINRHFMNHIILLLLLFTVYPANANLTPREKASDAELDYIRTAFYASVEDSKKSDLLASYVAYRFSDDESTYEPIIMAYSGAIDALQAKHAFNPFVKLSYVRSSLRKLHVSVNKAPRNPEIRFLRFSVLHHIPSFLGYGPMLRQDRDMLYTVLIEEGQHTTLEKQTLVGVLEFLLDSQRLTPEQERSVHQLYSTIDAHGHVPYH
jgi:hypothetical protein